MSFWDHHSALFLVFAIIFPRLTILFATGLPAVFGVLGWIGWFFVPRFMIAYYATVTFGDTNPFLVAVAWIVAILALMGAGGEGARRVR
jgi:hypothetical protein